MFVNINFVVIKKGTKVVVSLSSKEKKEKKTKHGSVLRHVVLKSVSGQMVSASVSILENEEVIVSSE